MIGAHPRAKKCNFVEQAPHDLPARISLPDRMGSNRDRCEPDAVSSYGENSGSQQPRQEFATEVTMHGRFKQQIKL